MMSSASWAGVDAAPAGRLDACVPATRRGAPALRRVLLAGALVLGVMAWQGRHAPLRLLGDALVHEDALRPADVAVVSMASPREAALDAAKLARRGLVREIWVPRWRADAVDRRLDALGVRVARPHDVVRAVLARAGVPASAVVLLDEPIDGLESEMASVGAALRARPGLRVLVLTSRTHTARARLLLREVFAPAARIRMRAPHGDRFSSLSWWRERGTARDVLLEYAKCARLLLSGPSPSPRNSK